jgi:3-oxoacyl-[acyl-carrier protein] reductase
LVLRITRHYVTAKAAVVGLVRAAARGAHETGPVNAVAPGRSIRRCDRSGREPAYVASLPLGRLGRPDEIARAVMDVAAWTWATARSSP